MKFIALNTIGLTGAEIIAAELARFPDVLMLPGQNFIQFEGRLYRPHVYDGWTPEAIFESLHTHLFTRSGVCWAGLTKSLRTSAPSLYSKDQHRLHFIAMADERGTTLDYFRLFALSYAESAGEPWADKRSFGFFGHNILLNAPYYPDFSERAQVIDTTNPIDYWLANIGQRMVWDSLGAVRFWLVNSLFSRLTALEGGHPFLAVDIRDYVADPDAVRSRLRTFLGSSGQTTSSPPGFIDFDSGHVKAIESNASVLLTLYREEAAFQAALHFGEWCDAFLADPANRRRLRDYQRFWNSTAHTNFDWVGPIETEIVERVAEHTGYRTEPSLSRWFYHECFSLNSDAWERPVCHLEHHLGRLEEDILLPEMPYFARIVLGYLESVASNFIKRPDSRLPLRESDLYRRLTRPEYRRHFPRWALVDRFAEVEARIDAACSGLR